MDIIDDQGRIFGLVNIIDLLVVLLALAIVMAGAALITSPTPPESSPTSPTTPDTHTQVVTFRTTPQPEYVVDAIPTGAVPTDEIVAVNEKSVTTNNDSLSVATVQVELRVTLEGNFTRFGGDRLYIGRSLRLDFGRTIVDGDIIDMEPIDTAN